jgi:integrase
VLWDHVTTGLGLRLRAGSPSTWIYRRRAEGKLIKRTLDQAAKGDPVEVACFRLLILTGARRGEALGLEWSMVQRDRTTLPDSKTCPKCL